MSQVTIVEALHLAMQHHNAGRLREAEAIYRQILAADPNHADALHLLGVVAHQCNQHDAAIELIRKSLSSHPNNAAAYNNLGEAYRLSGRAAQATEAYTTAIQQNPQGAEAIGNLGLMLYNDNKIDEAIAQYYRALAINPRLPQTLSNLGNALLNRKDMERAMTAYDAAIAADPMLADAHNNRGSGLEQLDRLDEAYDEYRRAVEINPNFAIACNNAANVSRRLCRWEEARAWCKRALTIDPNLDAAKWNEGLIELTLGFYAIGLPKYELRFVATTQRLPNDLFGMRWDGSPLEGRTILLVGEQGVGDTFQAARYIPLLEERGGKVIVESSPAAHSMLQRLPGVTQLIRQGEPRPDFDVYVPMMSLPLLFNTTLTTIENRVPYLHAEPDRIDAWRDRLSQHSVVKGVVNGAANGAVKKIGLIWRGSSIPEPLRSCLLSDLAPLGQVDGVQFFSLQVREGAEEAKSPPPGLNLIDLSADVLDFAETAACMMNLDLIITVDTAGAHLAGALARPTWVLLPISPDWRWMLDKSDSIWYPTLRLFRQTVRKQWGDVVQRVVDALKEFASQ